MMNKGVSDQGRGVYKPNIRPKADTRESMQEKMKDLRRIYRSGESI